MYYDNICNIVAKIKSALHTSNPFTIIEATDIITFFEPLGTCAKGFFVCECGERSIIINSDLPENIQRIIAAHELGHALLHAGMDLWFFQDYTFLDDKDTLEKEANMFAAELLISDGDVIEMLGDGETAYNVSAKLNVPLPLLLFKIRLMNLVKGYNIPEPSLNANCTFLYNMEVAYNE